MTVPLKHLYFDYFIAKKEQQLTTAHETLKSNHSLKKTYQVITTVVMQSYYMKNLIIFN